MYAVKPYLLRLASLGYPGSRWRWARPDPSEV